MWLLESEDIEYIQDHLDQPDTIWEESFLEWLSIEEHRKQFEKVRNYREALFRYEKEPSIDMEKEWKRFEIKTKKGRNWNIRKIGVIAASILILFVVSILWQPLEPETVKVIQATQLAGKKSAQLILANGQQIDLEKQPGTFQEENKIHITNTLQGYLAYEQEVQTPVVDSAEQLIYHTLKIPAGADYKLHLADGTDVWLNCGSELRYPVKFVGNERRVFLEGEAFFDVKKAADRPFIVETEQMHIQVTGTRFNVKAYRTEEIVHTTLVKGAVTISKPEDRECTFLLLPDQQFCLDKRSGQVEVKEVDTHLYTDWTEGQFVFRKQRLEDVMNTLSRWYDIEVFYVTPTVKDLCLSAHVGRYDHIDTILHMIQAMDKVMVMRKGKVITFSWK